jgi:hypothetical protein
VIQHVHAFTLPAAFALLPDAMDALEARAMVLAIGLQESRFKHRRQVQGPARGFWQFEIGGGVAGVLTHPVSKPHIERVLLALRYVPAASACFDAIEHNDVLACVFARLNLLTDPLPLPMQEDPENGWLTYVRVWRPGRPHRQTWDANFAEAWALVRRCDGREAAPLP